jgi:hypothetical protein
LPESAAAMVGRADGGDRRQSATQKTLVAEGMPDIGPGARRYIGKPVITSGSGSAPSLPFLSLFLSPSSRRRADRGAHAPGRHEHGPVVVPRTRGGARAIQRRRLSIDSRFQHYGRRLFKLYWYLIIRFI